MEGRTWAIRAAKETGGAPNVVFLSDGHEAPPLGTGAHPQFDDVKPGDARGWLIGVGGYTPQPIPRTDDEGKLIGYWRAEDVMQTDASDDGGASRELCPRCASAIYARSRRKSASSTHASPDRRR